MPDTTPPSSSRSTPPARPARRRHGLRTTLLILALLLALLAGLGFAAVKTEWGARALWQLATRALPDQLAGDFAGGTLADGIRLRNVSYRDPDRVIAIDRLDAAWAVTLDPPTLTIPSLALGKVEATLQPSAPGEPPTLPQALRLPLAFDLKSATVDELLVHRDGATTRLAGIGLSASSDRVHHQLRLELAQTPVGKAAAALRIEGVHPFPLDGTATLEGKLEDEEYRIDARASGTLEAPMVALDVAGGRLAGQVRVDATPFAPVPFERAQIDVRHLDPRAFVPTAPRADLTIHADLAPLAGGQAPADLSQLAVTGPITVVNAKPGPIDQELLPLLQARADAVLDADRQELSKLEIQLAGGGSLSGGAHFSGAGQGGLALTASRLDLRALHGALRQTRLKGPLEIRLDGQNQEIALDWSDPVFSAKLDAKITPAQVLLRSARLQSGPALLAAEGNLERAAQGGFSARGKLSDFEPARFLADMRIKQAGIPQARINMEFDAKGTLEPEPRATVRFDIRDSTYDRLPMSGTGRIQVAGTRIADSNARLSVAGNQASVKGGFGAPGARLEFSIDAPALDRLGFGLGGRLQADGVLGGTMARPLVDARIRGERLAFAEYRAARVDGQARTEGVPGSDPNARIALQLEARDIQGGPAALARLRASLDGSYASHALSLEAAGKVRGQPLDLSLSANGRLRELPEGLAWDGALSTLQNKGLPRFSLENPLPLALAPNRIQAGPARLSIEQAQVALQSLEYRQGSLLRSQGSIQRLDLGHLLQLSRQLTGKEPPLKTDLVLDGEWNIALAGSASGSFRFARRSGDITIRDGAAAGKLGLEQLVLDGTLDGTQLSLDARLAAQRIGSATGQGRIGLLPVDGLLLPAPESALSARIEAGIPRLAGIAALAGPSIALEGSVALRLEAQGTLGQPRLSGAVDGEKLALTLFEQGVRLRDGTARLLLDDNVVELRQLEFRGGEGTLRATGRIPLDRADSGLTASVVADRLQLLADPSASLTLSGQADLTNPGGQLTARGKFTVDQARFSLPEQRAPSLGDDVVIYRPGQKPKTVDGGPAEPKASPFLPVTEIEINLGRRFHFEGGGANLRLAGSIHVTSAPNQAPEANGTINIVDGVYEAFGAELKIERGIITFNGSFSNPAINILAMRRGQEVEAGVQVSGTARQPRIKLVSEPDVAEEEKLSWLVFGRPGSSEGGGAQAAARGAALGLLNSMGGERIAKGLGLDQLSIGTSEFGEGTSQVINLGKSISDRLHLGYEQSLAGAGSVLKLTYDLGRAWSVVLRGGQVTGLDVFYNKRFD